MALVGERRRTVQITVDTDQLNQFGLSIDDVRRALASQNLELPGGRVDQGKRELVLRVLGRYNTTERFNDLVVATRGGYPIRIRDIGRAGESVEDPRTLARLDGVPAVSLIVRKQSGSNTVEVVRLIKERLATIVKTLPADIRVQTVRDQSIFINRSIEEVQFHLLLAAGLVSLTILGFINDWRTTLIATSAIPASIIATFACMLALGFTLNNITMLALVLAIGIVIDDAVVVHENIFRHMEEHGRPAMEAARGRHGGDRAGGHGDEPVAGRHLRAGRLHAGAGRAALQQLRPDDRVRHPGEPVRLVHAHADALQPVPQGRARPGRGLEVEPGLPRGRGLVRRGARVVAAAQGAGRPRLAGPDGLGVSAAPHDGPGVHPARRPERVRGPGDRAGRDEPGEDGHASSPSSKPG